MLESPRVTTHTAVSALTADVMSGFWATVASNGSPYAMGPLSCLSVT